VAGFEESPGGIRLVVDGRIRRADVDALCASVRPLLDRRAAGRVAFDVAALTHPDGVAIDALARLQLAARRRDQSIGLRNACPRLQDLIVLAGLSDVLPLSDGSVFERLGQSEQREQLGVEEAVDGGDAAV
jgi:hypothetical protein